MRITDAKLKLTSRFASDFQNSQPRRKLTRTTFFFFLPLGDSSRPIEELGFDEILRDACKNLRTSQLDVAPKMDETSVNEDSCWVDRYGARRGGSGG